MVAAFLLAAIVILNSAIATQAADSNNADVNDMPEMKSVLTINDTILELFHNCKCIAYYFCDDVNKYLNAARKGVLKEDMLCSNKNLVCCKHVPEGVTSGETNGDGDPNSGKETTTISTTSSTTASTQEPEERHTAFEIDKGCGVSRTDISTRILTPETESATTIPGEVPWLIAIFQKTKTSKPPYKFKCPGSLIHPRVVLTTTHCVLSSTPANLKIVATGKETFQNVGNPSNERTVEKIIKHPKYYSGGLYNDIALLILTEEFDYNKNQINSICLPNIADNFTGKKCLAVGWGQNPTLQAIPLKKVDVPVVEFNHCQDLLRNTRLGTDFTLDSSFMCAGGEEGKDTCKGDGGAPLICLGDEYKFVQAGIVSWGVEMDKCGKKDQPGIYTDVTKFRQWIDEKMKENNITTNS